MFFSEHRLKMTSLRIGKHRIVKNIASLRKVNIVHPYSRVKLSFTWLFLSFDGSFSPVCVFHILIIMVNGVVKKNARTL